MNPVVIGDENTHGSFRVLGAAQHEVMRCRPGTVPHSDFVTVPDQRLTAISAFTRVLDALWALHRFRDTISLTPFYRF